MAYQDQKSTALSSNDHILAVVTNPFPTVKLDDKKKPDKTGYQVVSTFLSRHPDLYQAVSDALNRNTLTLGLTKLEPPPLELLRAPPRIGAKEK